MKKVFAGLLMVLFATGVLLASGQPAYSEPSKEAVKFLQIHYFTGLNEMLIAKDAIRVENKGRMKFLLVARAPSWDVTMFRNDDKSFYSQKLSDFQKSGILSDLLIGSRERLMDQSVFRRSTVLFNGFRATRLSSDHSSLDYLPLSQVLNCEPQIESIVYLLYKMPTNGGIPLRCSSLKVGKDFITGMDEAGNRQTELNTVRLTKVTVPSSIFDPPVGYKRGKSVREMVSGTAARADSEEILNALMTSGKKKP